MACNLLSVSGEEKGERRWGNVRGDSRMTDVTQGEERETFRMVFLKLIRQFYFVTLHELVVNSVKLLLNMCGGTLMKFIRTSFTWLWAEVLLQILLVAGFNIVLFTSKHRIKNIMSIHIPSADERLLSPTLAPTIDLCAFALSLSSRPITAEAAKEFTTNDSGNRDSEQPWQYEHRYKK